LTTSDAADRPRPAQPEGLRAATGRLRAGTPRRCHRIACVAPARRRPVGARNECL